MGLKCVVNPLLISALLLIIIVGCKADKFEKQSPDPPPTISPSLNVNTTGSTASTLDASSIRSVDFGNIDYPEYPNYLDDKSDTITLKAGEAKPDYIYFGDVNGDKIEDAVVVLLVRTHGTAIPQQVYFYTLQNNHLKLLWNVEAGDRGDGGIRQISVESGELVVELYGRNKLLGSVNEFDPESSTCCPKSYTRARYSWQGKRFKQLGKAEILPNPSGDDSVLMSTYSSFNRQ